MNTSSHSAAIAALGRGSPDRTETQASGRGGYLWKRIAAPALRASAMFWFGAAVVGQVLMAGYVVGFYGRTALQGRPELWNKVLSSPGYVAGDSVFNLVLSLHLLFAVLITVGGTLQLIPWIRSHAPDFHRWNGRAYLLAAAIMSMGGLAMVWIADGGVNDHMSLDLAVSLNAVLILGFAGIAWRHARARRLDVHRRWALRLFLAVSGVWFFRVGLMFWIVVNQGPVGFDPETFTGPALTILGFGQYLLPLAVLELYFRAQRSGDSRAKLFMAGGLGVLTLLMMVGIVAAAMIMWLPHMLEY